MEDDSFDDSYRADKAEDAEDGFEYALSDLFSHASNGSISLHLIWNAAINAAAELCDTRVIVCRGAAEDEPDNASDLKARADHVEMMADEVRMLLIKRQQ